MNEPKLELIKKLKALAEQGVGGEKVNAEKMLKDTLEKHGLTEEDLKTIEKKYRPIKCSAEQYDSGFALQLIYHVIEDPSPRGYVNDDTQRTIRTQLAVDCTVEEQLEIQATLDFFWERYKEEQKLFYQAFIVKNGLFPKNPNTGSAVEKEKDYRKILRMAEGIDKHQYHKQIEN